MKKTTQRGLYNIRIAVENTSGTTQLIWNGSGKFSLALHKKAEEVLAVVVTEQIRGLMK